MKEKEILENTEKDLGKETGTESAITMIVVRENGNENAANEVTEESERGKEVKEKEQKELKGKGLTGNESTGNVLTGKELKESAVKEKGVIEKGITAVVDATECSFLQVFKITFEYSLFCLLTITVLLFQP